MQALVTDRGNIDGHLWLELPNGNRLLIQHLKDRVQRRRRLEGRAARQAFVQDGPQAVDVRRGRLVVYRGPAPEPYSWACPSQPRWASNRHRLQNGGPGRSR